MISVLIWAADATARDGVANLLEGMPGVEVVGVTADEVALVRFLEAVRVDLVVAASDSNSAGDLPPGLAEDVAMIALVTDVADAVMALRAGVRAVLLRPTCRAEIAAAIQAVAAGLSVLPADLLNHLVRPGGGEGASANTEALTPRELEVLALLAAGASNKWIARRLGISVHTAKFHVAGVLEKLSAHSRAEAVAVAARLGLVLL
ncbi:MAG: two-component system, NarL family, nitrate/nitrite response regulator NarL [Rhodospirillaceae bacterium]|nr:two-component system, NarL family, nitrate/nitrite response regulator NarL [Rhodospirillaceae bacterium]